MASRSRTNMDLRAEVIASPAYRERASDLFELFRASRRVSGDPTSLLSIQDGLARLMMNWQEKQGEFNRQGDELGIAVTRRLNLVLKRIADSMVWRALKYDRVALQLLAEHPQTGFLDRDTSLVDIERAWRIVKENHGAIVLINDLTTTLRHGDLTVIYPDDRGIEIVENKTGTGSRRNARARRQKKQLNRLLGFLNTGTRVGKDGTRDHLVRLAIPVRSHHMATAGAIERARREGYCREVLSACLAVEAVQIDHPAASLPKQRPFADVEHALSHGNLDRGLFHAVTPRIAPYGIFPFDDKSCFDLTIGTLQLVTTINYDALADVFAEFGLALDIPQPSQQDIAAYMSASIAERKAELKHSRKSWFVVRDGRHSLRISPDTWGRISLDLIHETTVAHAYGRVMAQLVDWSLAEDTTTRMYVGYENERSIWT